MNSRRLIAIVTIGILLAGLILWIHSFSNVEATTPPLSAIQKITEYKSTSIPTLATGGSKKAACSLWCARLDGKTVGQYVNGLYGAANNGDKLAAFKIYRAETICAMAPHVQQNIKEMSLANGPAFFASYQSTVDDIQSVCADFSGSERERLKYLLMAVKGGAPGAASSFAYEPPEGVDNFHLERIDPKDPRVIQWKKDAIDYLTQAATQGDTSAIITLYGFYLNGAMTPQNLQLALTYKIALTEIQNEDLNSADITELSGRLSPDQVSEANSAANQLVNSCCAKQ